MEKKVHALPTLTLQNGKSLSEQELMAEQAHPAGAGAGEAGHHQPSPAGTPDSRYLKTSSSIDSFGDMSRRYSISTTGPLAGQGGQGQGQGQGHGLKREKSWYSKRVRRRLCYKNGECNISHVNIKKRRQRYLADIFTTLVDIKWRWNLLIFVMAFTLSWLLFALCWWLICFSHGDFENRPGHKPCVVDVYDFTTALLFSIETQHTIGYGSRHTTPNCPEAILVMMFQSCFGVIIQALMTGLVFAKLSRPKKRAETLMFSKNAVVCKRDGQLCLLFRVGDMRKSHIVEAHVRAIMIKRRVTEEGEVMPLYQYEVPVGDEEGERRLFLVWPVIVEHRIDENSPFWDVSPDDLHKEQFELIIILEGIVESTGMTTQARTSYLPGEILWGHRFERLVTYQKENGDYEIDYSRFHSTIPVDIPQCSGKELLESGGTAGMGRGDGGEEDEDEEEDGRSHRPADNVSVISETSSAPGAGCPKPLTPFIMKRNGIAQTAFDLDPDSPDFQDYQHPVDTYHLMGNRL